MVQLPFFRFTFSFSRFSQFRLVFAPILARCSLLACSLSVWLRFRLVCYLHVSPLPSSRFVSPVLRSFARFCLFCCCSAAVLLLFLPVSQALAVSCLLGLAIAPLARVTLYPLSPQVV